MRVTSTTYPLDAYSGKGTHASLAAFAHSSLAEHTHAQMAGKIEGKRFWIDNKAIVGQDVYLAFTVEEAE